MILDFADKATESVWHGERSRRLPTSIQDIARRKMRKRLKICAFRPPTGWKR